MSDGHGGKALRAARSLGFPPGQILDLSANLNPFAPDVADVIGDLSAALRHYPDVEHATELLAAALGVTASRLVLTNGAAEGIALVAGLDPVGDVREPEFSLYRRHLRDVVPGAPRWRSNPGAPLGRLAEPSDAAHVWDESYFPLATGIWSRGDSASWRIGSLTKVWACAGVRLGYVVAPDDHGADAIRRAQPRWSVNGIASAIVEPMLERTDLPGWTERIARQRTVVAEELAARGWQVVEGAAPWLVVRDAAAQVPEWYRRGVLVRDLSSYGLSGSVRIAVPDDRGLDRLLTVIDEVTPCAR